MGKNMITNEKNIDHLVMVGDCLSKLKEIPSESVDLIITDPPYNIGLKYDKKVFVDRKSTKEYFEWLEKRLEGCARVLKKTGSIYLINYPELNARTLPFLEDKLKLKFRRWMVWNYPTNIGHSKKNWTRSHRSILFLTKGNKYTFNREMALQHYKNPEVKKIKERIAKGSKGRNAYDILRFIDLFELQKGMIDVQEINLSKNVTKERVKGHPCQLPLPLLRLLVKVSSNEKDTVLDPFAGTFTLSTVAKELNRKSVGIEISKKYCEMGARRLGQ